MEGPVTAGNALAGLKGILAAAGVVETRARDEVEEYVSDFLHRVGLEGRMRQLRHGRLVLEAGPQAAGFLKYETQNLLEELRERFPGVVSAVVVWVV